MSPPRPSMHFSKALQPGLHIPLGVEEGNCQSQVQRENFQKCVDFFKGWGWVLMLMQYQCSPLKRRHKKMKKSQGQISSSMWLRWLNPSGVGWGRCRVSSEASFSLHTPVSRPGFLLLDWPLRLTLWLGPPRLCSTG